MPSDRSVAMFKASFQNSVIKGKMDAPRLFALFGMLVRCVAHDEDFKGVPSTERTLANFDKKYRVKGCIF